MPKRWPSFGEHLLLPVEKLREAMNCQNLKPRFQIYTQKLLLTIALRLETFLSFFLKKKMYLRYAAVLLTL